MFKETLLELAEDGIDSREYQRSKSKRISIPVRQEQDMIPRILRYQVQCSEKILMEHQVGLYQILHVRENI